MNAHGTRWRNALLVIASMLGGIATSLCAYAITAHTTRHDSLRTAVQYPTSAIDNRQIENRSAVDDTRILAIDARLRDLEERAASPSPAAKPETTPSFPEAATNTRAPWKERYDTEGVDARWAGAAQVSFSRELEQMKEALSLSSIDVTCRTTVCSAVLQWPDFTTARKHALDVVHRGYAMNCAKSISVPPQHGSGPYTATAYFDCEKFRSEQ